jgi:hypothetical protein
MQIVAMQYTMQLKEFDRISPSNHTRSSPMKSRGERGDGEGIIPLALSSHLDGAPSG